MKQPSKWYMRHIHPSKVDGMLKHRAELQTKKGGRK